MAAPSEDFASKGSRRVTLPGGPALDPDTLHLVLGSATTSCEQPLSPVGCTDTSRVTLSLPPSLQQPGIIDLTDPAVDASFAVSASASAPCGPDKRVSGSFAGGTVEILSIDASGVLARVYGSFTRSFDADGLYAASICP